MTENQKLQLTEGPRLMLKTHYIANSQVNNPIAGLGIVDVVKFEKVDLFV